MIVGGFCGSVGTTDACWGLGGATVADFGAVIAGLGLVICDLNRTLLDGFDFGQVFSCVVTCVVFAVVVVVVVVLELTPEDRKFQ